MELLNLVLLLIIGSISTLVMAQTLLAIGSMIHLPRSKKKPIFHNYKISVLLPAHNEELVIKRTITRFLNSEYPAAFKELIISNDNSIDKTEQIARRYAGTILNVTDAGTTIERNSNTIPNITLINRKTSKRGKSFAVNDAIKYATGSLLFFIDADVQLGKDSLLIAGDELYKNPKLDAICGFCSVNKYGAILQKFIDFEYVVSQKLMRGGYNLLGFQFVMPGGCVIFRRPLIEKLKGYEHDTLAEDTDITWRAITEQHAKVKFFPYLEVRADEPSGLIGLWKQRVRWARGNIEITRKHGYKIGKLQYGRPATLGAPMWLFILFSPFIYVIGSLALAVMILDNIMIPLVGAFGILMTASFYINWILGSVANNMRSTFGGLFSLGLPLLLFMSSFLIYQGGIIGYLQAIGLPLVAKTIDMLMICWVFIGVLGSFLCIEISDRYPGIAIPTQLFLFGYNNMMVAANIQAYYEEITGKTQVWVRTPRI